MLGFENMKRNFTLVLVAIILGLSLSQCKSKEDKALALINEQMFKTLYDYDSYQPVETKIDSAFHTPFNDPVNLEYAVCCSVLYDKLDEYIQEVKNAQNKVEIWSDSYSSYGRKQYRKALAEAAGSLLVADYFLNNKIKPYQDSIRIRSNEFDKDFIGWQVTHTFRCKTKGGYSDLSTNIYIMDKELTTIMDVVNVEDENYMKFQKIIKEALEKDSTTDENSMEK
jgi:hypothetical protein